MTTWALFARTTGVPSLLLNNARYRTNRQSLADGAGAIVWMGSSSHAGGQDCNDGGQG